MSKALLHTPEGVRDIYGNEFSRKLDIEKKVHDTIMKYGYEDIQTPTFEFFEVYSEQMGTIPSKELYKFFDKEGNTLVLRPDFTPSIARCAAKYFMEEEVPLRLCYQGSTFSNTSSLQGKLNEVTQMGVELINDDSVEADAEMLSLVIETVKSTGLENFQLSIGQIDFFKGLCEEAGLDAETENELREYISGKNYFAAEDLLATKEVKDPYKDTLLKLADMHGDIDSIKDIKKLVNNKRSVEAIERLENIFEVLKLYGVEKYVSFDLGMLSKYHYYTGIMFSVYTYGVGEPIVNGGRYNNLLQKFGKTSPAIGFAVVIDDLIDAMKHQKINTYEAKTNMKIYYNQNNFSAKLKETIALRNEGIAVELLPEK